MINTVLSINAVLLITNNVFIKEKSWRSL